MGLKRPKAFVEGYLASSRGITRMRSPYKHQAAVGVVDAIQDHEHWLAGWQKHFWGEAINSPDPEP